MKMLFDNLNCVVVYLGTKLKKKFRLAKKTSRKNFVFML